MLDTHTPKERIKREAMRLFVEHGVDAVSMRDIADAAGLKAPSLYAHFRSRDQLILDLFAASYADYGRQIATAAATKGTAQDQLKAMVTLVCELHAKDELLFNFLLLTQHGSLRQIPEADHNPVEIICRWVETAMNTGKIPQGNPTLTAASIIGAIVQTATFKLYGRLPEGLSEHTEELTKICLKLIS